MGALQAARLEEVDLRGWICDRQEGTPQPIPSLYGRQDSKRADEVPPGYIRSFIPKDIEGKADLVYYHTSIINQEFSVTFQT